jgi:hypothetical protein
MMLADGGFKLLLVSPACQPFSLPAVYLVLQLLPFFPSHIFFQGMKQQVKAAA